MYRLTVINITNIKKQIIMHTPVILLVKATDSAEALELVNEFMEPYGEGDVWDWFSIGGRWSNEVTDIRKPDEEINIAPLNECIETVKKARVDLKEKAEEMFTKLCEERENEKKNPEEFKMSGYYARLYNNYLSGYFCFETGVYNVEEGEAEHIPENTDGYYAVMVDMHN